MQILLVSKIIGGTSKASPRPQTITSNIFTYFDAISKTLMGGSKNLAKTIPKESFDRMIRPIKK